MQKKRGGGWQGLVGIRFSLHAYMQDENGSRCVMDAAAASLLCPGLSVLPAARRLLSKGSAAADRAYPLIFPRDILPTSKLTSPLI